MGNNSALYSYAMVHLKSDKAEQIRVLKRYVELGGSSTAELALSYVADDLPSKHIDEYIRLLKLGVRRGDGNAAAFLATETYNGHYAAKDFARAADLYEFAIKQALNRSSARNLGEMYRDGEGGPVNLAKATYWLVLAAKQGDIEGAMDLYKLMKAGGAVFKQGYGPSDSFDSSVFVRMAADAGDAEAQFKLGSMIEDAQRRAGSLKEAISWYRRAAAGKPQRRRTALERLSAGQQ